MYAIAFRFSERSWESWPLKSETFGNWVNSIPWNQEIVNLFMLKGHTKPQIQFQRELCAIKNIIKYQKWA